MTVGYRKSASHSAKCYPVVSESSVSLERTGDSISIRDLAENSEVSLLIPHSVAASHTMVSTRPLSLGRTYAHNMIKSKSPFMWHITRKGSHQSLAVSRGVAECRHLYQSLSMSKISSEQRGYDNIIPLILPALTCF